MRRLMRLVSGVLSLAVLVLLLAACGGGSSGSSSGEASKPAREIVSDMAKALQGVRSYHVAGTGVDKDGTTRLAGDVTASGSVRFTMAIGAKRAQIIVAGSQTFVKADREFWLAQGGPDRDTVAKLLADRWAKVPESAATGVKASLDPLLPKTLAYCATHAAGTVTKKGTRQFAGQRVIVLADRGDLPGDSPSDLYVAASGPTLPVRVVQTGPQTPGRPDPRCGDEDSTTTRSEARLSAFNEPVHIAPPPNALDVGKLSGGSGAA